MYCDGMPDALTAIGPQAAPRGRAPGFPPAMLTLSPSCVKTDRRVLRQDRTRRGYRRNCGLIVGACKANMLERWMSSDSDSACAASVSYG